MRDVEQKMRDRAAELLQSGEVNRIVGWKKGEFYFDPMPAVFESVEELKDFVYNGFCGANLSKYLIEKSKLEGKTAVFLKPCDSFSFNQLLKEHRIKREKIHVIAVECQGKYDIYKVKEKVTGVLEVEERAEEVVFTTLYGEKVCAKGDLLLERCITCKSKQHQVKDEEIILNEMHEGKMDRFAGVNRIQSLKDEQRFAFFRSELSRCIRCYACRNVCPACSCVKCVFDNADSGVSAKANDTEFEENLFHVIRAYHVAGRCTDCGECSRVCPQRIPLHLLNRKFIKEINQSYGEYQAGEDAEGKHPLISFDEGDKEPHQIVYKEGK